MSEPTLSTDSAAVDLAINQVLAAERDARAAVQHCREEAAAIVAAAEERARCVSARTGQRVKAAHRTADLAVEHALRELLGSEAGIAADALDEADDERIDRAVTALAEEIVGPRP